MDKIRILWADDEMDHLKPQLFFLEKKGYDVTTVSNGHDALELIQKHKHYDVVLLDESMPGITGLETLSRIRAFDTLVPVILVTKNEAENLMEEAIGSQIHDYLIKPVNPNQLLLSLKKVLDNKRLIAEKNVTDYQTAFRKLSMDISMVSNFEEWVGIYKELIQWELKLDSSNFPDMEDILSNQKQMANTEFSKYICNNYTKWFEPNQKKPLMSDKLLYTLLFPHLKDDVPTIAILLDNLRFDQWKAIEPIISELYRVDSEDYFFSILPATTQYSRNAIFSGMMPVEIEKVYPDWWLNDNEEGGKNMKEPDMLIQQIKRVVRKEIKSEYIKITNGSQGKSFLDNVTNYLNNNLTIVVYNFIDLMSHTRTEMEVLKELANDEKAYRSLTKSWFLHSPLWQAMQKLASHKIQLCILTDHGTIRVNSPSKVIGDKETTTNLRYKVGKNLNYEKRDVLEIKDPHKVGLPKPNISSTFIFAKEDSFFLYPNNYNYYQNYYKNTFQHGGISMEEMICPFIKLSPK